MTECVIGIACYSADDYPTIRVMMDDAEALPHNFESWRKSAELQTRLFRRSGALVYCIDITPREFSDWCKAEGLHPDALARTRFVTLAAHRKARSQFPVD